MGTFAFFDHAADVGIELEADSLQDLFATAASALMKWMGPAPECTASICERVHLEADDLEDLLVRWLQELLFLFYKRRCYWHEMAALEVSGCTMDAAIVGSVWDEATPCRFQEVKAVTYHQIEVRELEGSWKARVILDI
jgi:SHS2 domain-containing protein